jgi:hypothetical protein
MINFFGQLLGADIMPGREPYPPSALIRLYHDEAGEPLALVGGGELHAELAGLPKFSDVTLGRRWRQVDLPAAQSGCSGLPT